MYVYNTSALTDLLVPGDGGVPAGVRFAAVFVAVFVVVVVVERFRSPGFSGSRRLGRRFVSFGPAYLYYYDIYEKDKTDDDRRTGIYTLVNNIYRI